MGAFLLVCTEEGEGMRAPPAARAFDMSPSPTGPYYNPSMGMNQAPFIHSYQNQLVEASLGGGGDPDLPLPSLETNAPGSPPSLGPRGLLFNGSEDQLPPPNLDRASQRLQAEHEFVTTGTHSMEEAIRRQQDLRQRGTVSLEGTMENEARRGDVFFHAIYGSVEGVRRAVVEYEGLVNQWDQHGFTPLHYACRRPALCIVRYLLEAGADVHAISRNRMQDQPLGAAAEGGDVAIIHALQQHQADLNYRNSLGLTPLHLAIKGHQALASAYLILHGADMERADQEGHTALHWAAYRGETKVLEILLDSGARVRAVDHNGMNPLHWATVRGHLDCLEMLYRRAPDLAQVATSQGLRPVEMAIKYKQPDSQEFLEEQEQAVQSTRWLGLLAGLVHHDAHSYYLAGASVATFLALLAYSPWWWVVVGSLVLLFLQSLLVDLHSNERNGTMMGVFLWSHLLSNLVYFTLLLPSTWDTLWWFHVPFFVANLYIYELYRRLALDDPGFLTPNREDLERLLRDLARGNPTERYCATCWVYKPYRSKHCRDCGCCVLKLDHHCPFTGNCVAVNNLHWFYVGQSFYVVGELAWLWLCYQYGLTLPGHPEEEEWIPMFLFLSQAAPFLWATVCWHLFHACWMFPLWLVQSYQVATNLTTNEQWNRERYEYLKDPNTGIFYNPYDRGVVENIKEAFLCSYREVYRRTAELPGSPFHLQTAPPSSSLLPSPTETHTSMLPQDGAQEDRNKRR